MRTKRIVRLKVKELTEQQKLDLWDLVAESGVAAPFLAFDEGASIPLPA